MSFRPKVSGSVVIASLLVCPCAAAQPDQGAPGGVAATSLSPPRTAPEAVPEDGPEIVDPPQLRSRNGVLKATLEAAPARIAVAGRTFTSNVYNGRYVPPTLVLAPGERLDLTLVNNIGPADVEIGAPQASNVHYHGMVIPPVEPADNVYVAVPSGVAGVAPAGSHRDHPAPALGVMDLTAGRSPFREGNRYSYSWSVPPDHSRGINWYHPHVHGHVQNQILSGLSGLLLIDGFLEAHYPELAGLKRRQLVFKDIDLPGAPGGGPKTKTINGLLRGVIRAQPGDLQYWQLANIGADAFVDFALDGHKFWVVERDGNPLSRPEEVTSVYLPPASRAGVIVATGNAGTYGMRSLEVDNGPAGDANPERIIGSLIVEGQASENWRLRPRLLLPARDATAVEGTARGVRALPVTRRRTIRYTESADGNTFYIDGREFDMARDDVTVALGDVEEWTIVNDTDERHSFHIHQLDFLVMQMKGDDEDSTGLRDVIDIPYRVNGVPGSVTLRIPFRNPVMVGRFPFHCHITEHEDKGMMANVRVLPRPRAQTRE